MFLSHGEVADSKGEGIWAAEAALLLGGGVSMRHFITVIK